MEGNSDNTQFLIARIQQLERERDELHKDIEQLCMQQAGPSYLGVATRMHFQRTSALEQEIENLTKKLTACTRENQNLQEELSEAYHIKSQFADLYSAEVSKNMEAEKQLKFFQSSVAAAFAERDNAIMEAEKAVEKEELVSREMDSYKKRIEELSCQYLEEKKLVASMHTDQEQQEKQIESFRKVIDKFYAIRQQKLEVFEDTSWESKCKHLLDDSIEMWSFCSQDETSTSKYISTLEQEVETLRKSLDNLQNKLRVGLEIENHLRRQVSTLDKEKKKIHIGLSSLLDYHSKHRTDVMHSLNDGYSFLESTIIKVEEKFRQLELVAKQNLKSTEIEDIELHENDCRDIHVNSDIGLVSTARRGDPSMVTTTNTKGGDASEALAVALQGKVSALLLLSQEEERHLLERNLNIALQRKIEELQRNLLQVTNEKVKALMELAQLKCKHQILQENVSVNIKQGQPSTAIGEKRIMQEKDGKLRNLLKKSYLRHWAGNVDSESDNADSWLNYEGNFNQGKSATSLDFARMKIEHAALKESLESMKHLTASVDKLRLALLKANESAASEGGDVGFSLPVDDVITEAKLLKTALGSSLPISWSADVDVESQVDCFKEAIGCINADSINEKVDFVSVAGLEMVELLIFAAQAWEERSTHRS